MIVPTELLLHAAALLAVGSSKGRDPIPEADARRAVSASYYALFHALALDGAVRFAPSDPILQQRVVRSFEHRRMKEVCKTLERWNKGSQTELLKPLLSPTLDSRLLQVVDAFIEVQEARHTADYDLATSFPTDLALRLHRRVRDAHDAWLAIRDTPDAAVFLTLLLLGDRLYRRG